jgi:1-deoxy-D-xylulose-5-phosphate synthase
MLVVLNDNDMSISPPVGALNRYLARLMSGKFYAAARDTAKTVLKNAPPLVRARQALRGARQGDGRPGDRSSRSSASTTSARSTATTSTR